MRCVVDELVHVFASIDFGSLRGCRHLLCFFIALSCPSPCLYLFIQIAACAAVHCSPRKRQRATVQAALFTGVSVHSIFSSRDMHLDPLSVPCIVTSVECGDGSATKFDVTTDTVCQNCHFTVDKPGSKDDEVRPTPVRIVEWSAC